jgi:uncharacterized protein YqgC (DUF456 family)
MVWLYYFILLVVLVLGLALNLLSLPGLWLMVGGYALYAWMTGWNVYVGWPSLTTLLILALLAEAAEFFAGAAGSKVAGGRTRGMIGAVVGAFLGAIFLSVIPIIGVAQIIGACLGAFIGAAVMEFWDKDFAHSVRVGYGAAKGRFAGIIVKLGFGVMMLVIGIFAALPIGGAATVTQTPLTLPPLTPTPPSTQLSTQPATTTTTSPSTQPL